MADVVNKINAAVLSLLREFEQDNEAARSNLLTRIKKYELMWRGINDYYWDATVKDWRVPEVGSKLWLASQSESYNDVVNIQQAHGEAVIAALSVDTPKVTFFPEDAREPNDILTSNTFQKIGQIIQRDNDASLLQMRGIFTLFNQGLVGAYNYYEVSEDYGTDLALTTKTIKQSIKTFSCPSCGYDKLENDILQPCPNCESLVEPKVEDNEQEIPVGQEISSVPRGRVNIEMYGLLNLNIPHYAAAQKDIGILVLEFEQDSALIRSVYDKVNLPSRYGRTNEAREVRLSLIYDNTPQNLLTVKKVWIRPWKYKDCDEETQKLLIKSYPNGLRAVVVEDIVADVRAENMDSHWTLSQCPTSNTLIAEPKAAALAPIQNLTSMVKNLTIQTIEYGIPFTIADPEVFDFKAFAATKSRPGDFFKGKAGLGKKYQDSFFTIQPASMSQEIKEFSKDLQQDAQFVVGSFPSIYGGPSEGSSKTLGEYTQSRAYALQRLGITWKIINFFWAQMIHKSVILYVKRMKDDIKDTQKVQGNFVTTWIRRSELSGAIGRVEPESADVFPLTWAQRRDVIIQLMGMKDEVINSVLYHPENVDYMATAVGMPELYIPGKGDRIKQAREIQELLKDSPIEDVQGMDGNASNQPSVNVDPLLDDDQIHIEVIKIWALSEEGQYTQISNSPGFSNVMAHLQQHQMNMQKKTMSNFEGTQPGQKPVTAQS